MIIEPKIQSKNSKNSEISNKLTNNRDSRENKSKLLLEKIAISINVKPVEYESRRNKVVHSSTNASNNNVNVKNNVNNAEKKPTIQKGNTQEFKLPNNIFCESRRQGKFGFNLGNKAIAGRECLNQFIK